MNGAESLLQTLIDCGIEVCFANPGTSELQFVSALDRQPGMRGVLGLFEGVVTGAADGYARMARRPACTLLHLGPGLTNGMANLHNARRARVPIVNIVGEHATYHRPLDAPLTTDIQALASAASGWVRVSESSLTVASDGAAAVAAALSPPHQIATLILPADAAWNAARGPARPQRPPDFLPPDPATVSAAAQALQSGEPAALLMNGPALSADALDTAGRIAAATNARLFADTFVTRIARGAGRVDVQRIPYFSDQAVEALAPYRHLIVIGTKAPVSFFAYPGQPGELTPASCRVHLLASPEHDGPAALEALADALHASRFAPPHVQRPRRVVDCATGALTAEAIGQTISMLLPEQAIIVNEALTAGFTLPASTAGALPHDWLDLTGGAIGQGLPAAVGAAVACPERRVLALQADGSAMYTLQALWTMARESLDVTVILFANRKYAILEIELQRLGAGRPGPKANDMFDLSRPELEWVALARGMGVPATRATCAEQFAAQLARALATPGPSLVEAILTAGQSTE
jgi:acetolactate synthase-1/2/3 large subunit